MANYFRFDYFFQETKESKNQTAAPLEIDDGLGEGDSFKFRKFANPFDKGIFRNVLQFWGYEQGVQWHKLYSVEEQNEKTIAMV